MRDKLDVGLQTLSSLCTGRLLAATLCKAQDVVLEMLADVLHFRLFVGRSCPDVDAVESFTGRHDDAGDLVS